MRGSAQPSLRITRLLREMRLGLAIDLLRSGRGELDATAVRALILECETQASRSQAAGEIGEARRLTRRAAALNGLLSYGPDPARMVAEVELPAGYHGKILLVLLAGGGFERMICLRSGDAWHREILANTRAEIKDLGFEHTHVDPLGGAWARFEPDGSIVIWGTSDEYGCCDKEQAALMIARAHQDVVGEHPEALGARDGTWVLRDGKDRGSVLGPPERP